MPRLAAADVESLRAQSMPLPIMADSSIGSDSFKTMHAKSKPKSKNLHHHFSVESRDFSGSAMKSFANAISPRRIIPFGTGRPTADYYPWEHLTLRGIAPSLKDNGTENYLDKTTTTQSVAKQGNTYDLSIALNYGHAAGSSQLIRFMTEHVEIVHDPPYADWAVCLSCGSTSALEIAFRIFCNKGDTILTEQFTYPGALESAGLVGVQIQGVEMDAEGLRSDCLDKILRTWDTSRAPKPTVLYTIPTGQNPTGTSQSAERKRAIYEIAEKHDLIIVEDDPYYYHRMGAYLDQSPINKSPTDQIVDEPWTSLSIPSYVSIDRSGRVVRLDSASKILAPGLRAGWVTASSPIIDKFVCYHDVSVGAVSGPTQLMLWTLLDKSWGHSGFFSWLAELSFDYKCRRDIVLRACDRYMPREICRWVPPEYGMFFWVGLDWTQHPLLQGEKKQTNGNHSLKEQIEKRIQAVALANGVKVAEGSMFDVAPESSGNIQFRITFAAAPKSELDEGMHIFANTIREEFSLPTV